MPNMKSVTKILHSPSAGLQAILEKASVLQEINLQLQAFLPTPLNRHITLANVRGDTIVILADSSVWLTKARYQGTEILRFFTQDVGLTKLNKIQFKVQPHTDAAIKPETLGESGSAAGCLHRASDQLRDPSLKAAVEQLSNNFQPKV